MVVIMCVMRRWQDAGVERVLNVGQVVDLPDVIAEVFVASGLARPEMGPPEVQSPDPGLETSGRRRRHA